MPEPGTLVAGRYRIVSKLGSGGTAVVYAADDETLRRRVALKVLHVPTDESGTRLRREAKLGAGLRHPHLVTIFDVLMEGPAVVLVMELVEGPSLSALLAERRLTPDETLDILRPVADALDHAHASGIVHRDVKPANILVGPGGAELADLGIAHALESTRITAHGSVVGTPAYMAPEQLHGAEPSVAVDVYALAAVAFEMLAGRPARRGRNQLEIIDAFRSPPPDLRESWPDAPPAAADVLRRALATDPAERPATATELVETLAASLNPPEPEPAHPEPSLTPPPAPRREAPAKPRVGSDPVRRGPAAPGRRGPAIPAMLGLLLVAFLAGAFLILRGGDDEPPQRAERPRATATPEETATATATAEPTATPARKESAPAAAVREFYEAAADDFARSWEIAGPDFRGRFGSQAQLARELGTLERIRFRRLRVIEREGDRATVEIQTVATHTDRVDRCAGTLLVTRIDGRWRVDPLSLGC